jgi:hypothetical protein
MEEVEELREMMEKFKVVSDASTQKEDRLPQQRNRF